MLTDYGEENRETEELESLDGHWLPMRQFQRSLQNDVYRLVVDG